MRPSYYLLFVGDFLLMRGAFQTKRALQVYCIHIGGLLHSCDLLVFLSLSRNRKPSQTRLSGSPGVTRNKSKEIRSSAHAHSVKLMI